LSVNQRVAFPLFLPSFSLLFPKNGEEKNGRRTRSRVGATSFLSPSFPFSFPPVSTKRPHGISHFQSPLSFPLSFPPLFFLLSGSLVGDAKRKLHCLPPHFLFFSFFPPFPSWGVLGGEVFPSHSPPPPPSIAATSVDPLSASGSSLLSPSFFFLYCYSLPETKRKPIFLNFILFHEF